MEKSTLVFWGVIIFFCALLILIPRALNLPDEPIDEIDFFQDCQNMFTDVMFVRGSFTFSSRPLWFMIDSSTTSNIIQPEIYSGIKNDLFIKTRKNKDYRVFGVFGDGSKNQKNDSYNENFPFDRDEYGGVLGIPFLEKVDIMFSFETKMLQIAKASNGISAYPNNQVSNLVERGGKYYANVLFNNNHYEWLVDTGDNFSENGFMSLSSSGPASSGKISLVGVPNSETTIRKTRNRLDNFYFISLSRPVILSLYSKKILFI